MKDQNESNPIDYQKKIANILESFTDAFFEVDENWTVTYWNKESERLLMKPRSEVIGKNLWEVYENAIHLEFYSQYHIAVKENISVRFEEYFEPLNLWLEVAAFPSGHGLSVYFKDITKTKKATEQLEQEKQKYTELFNLSPLPQWVYDLDSLKFLDVNEAAIQHYGYSRTEFMNMFITEIRPEEDVSSLFAILRKDVYDGLFNKSTVRHKKKNGDVIDVSVEGNSVSFEGKNARLVMVIDRTKEIKSHIAKEESIARFNIVSKATSDAIWDMDMLTGQMVWNQGIRGIFGYHKTDYDREWWKNHIHPDDLAGVMQQLNMLVGKHEEKMHVEYRFLKADGSYCFVLDRAYIMFNEIGEPIRMIGSMQDITDRISHIKAIEDQNKKLKEISWIQSHKIRAPLARILGLAELVSIPGMTVSEQNEIVRYICQTTNELDSVLNEILKKVKT